MHTNKQRYIDQMINRDVVEKVHERMHNKLVAITKSDFAESEGGLSAGTTPHVNPDFTASGHWCRIAQDQSQMLNLPQFLRESQNASDPAFKVSASTQSEDVYKY